jgi:hypothetical protein
MAVSVDGNHSNIERLVEGNMHILIAEIFELTESDCDRYLDLLALIRALCEDNGGARDQSYLADYFISKYIHKTITKALNSTYNQYKKTNDLSTLGDTPEQVLHKYTIFAA